MKLIILISILFLFSYNANSQSLETRLAISACKYTDSVDFSKVVSPQEKKKAIIFVFAKAVEANQLAINSDDRFKGLHSYEQGKKLGQLMSKSVAALLEKDCPKFKKLLN